MEKRRPFVRLFSLIAKQRILFGSKNTSFKKKYAVYDLSAGIISIAVSVVLSHEIPVGMLIGEVSATGSPSSSSIQNLSTSVFLF